MKRRTTTLTIAIIVMLAMIAVASVWIVNRSRSIDTQKSSDTATGTEEVTEEENQEQPEEEAAPVQDDAEAKAASHVYSHRGKEGPEEHTFKAYDEAIAAGSRYIEPDVVISSDGVLYVSHDLNAIVMTDYNGMYEYIDSETVDSLKTDAGNPILRLSQVFDKYGRDINYVIELKATSDAAVKAFEDMVDQYGYSDIITVQCIDTDVLKKLDEKYPDMPKLFVCYSLSKMNDALDLPYVDIISVRTSAGLMTKENCDKVHEHGKQFSAWTVDDEETIKKAIDMGVDNYFTNDTPLALRLEREYGAEKRAQ